MVLEGEGGATGILLWKSCVHSELGQAHKSRIIGGNVRHPVSGSLWLSAVRRKAQSRRAARKMEEDVAEPIKTSVTSPLSDGSQSPEL